MFMKIRSTRDFKNLKICYSNTQLVNSWKKIFPCNVPSKWKKIYSLTTNQDIPDTKLLSLYMYFFLQNKQYLLTSVLLIEQNFESISDNVFFKFFLFQSSLVFCITFKQTRSKWFCSPKLFCSNLIFT
jgi:hypothetical protein